MTLNMEILRNRLRETFGDDSQEVVGKKLKMTQGNVSKLLSGSQQPTLETIFNIADIYGVSVDWILGRSEKKRKIDTASYASAVETLITLNRYGLVSIREDETGNMSIQLKDLIIKALLRNGVALSKVDNDFYRSWVEKNNLMFGDKPLLYDVAWSDTKTCFLAGQATTLSNWLEVYEVAKKVVDDYIEMIDDNPGPFGG